MKNELGAQTPGTEEKPSQLSEGWLWHASEDMVRVLPSTPASHRNRGGHFREAVGLAWQGRARQQDTPGPSPLMEFLWLQSAWWPEGRRIPSGKPDYSSTEDPQATSSNPGRFSSGLLQKLLLQIHDSLALSGTVTMRSFTVALPSSPKIREHQCSYVSFPSQFSDTKETARN